MSSFRLGRLLGVPVSLHWTFLGVLLALTLVALDAPGGSGPSSWGLIAYALGALVIHELGHALAARLAGVRVGGVVLHLFGGLTLMDPRSLKGWREVPAAAGGPLANLAMALLALLPDPGLARFGQVNLLFGGLNLLPIWPLDGGRILRALLAERLGRVQATLAAGVTGLLVQVALFFVILLFWPPLFLLVPIYLAVVGVRALQAELTAEIAARLVHGDPAEPVQDEPEPEGATQENPGSPPLASRLGRFRGSLAEYLQGRRR